MELTSENDLFFHYTHSLDEQGFRLVQEQQKLMVDFAEYAAVLIRMLNTCIKEPLQHLEQLVEHALELSARALAWLGLGSGLG